MNPFVLSFSDGTSFFVGLGVVLFAELLLFRFRGRITRPVLTVLAVVGMVLVVASATPLPLWVYALWAVPAIGTLVLGNFSRAGRWARLLAVATLLVTTVSLCAAEAPYHRSPRVVVAGGQKVYVLGDSISAGMGAGERCWPAVLKETTGLAVVNLAQPGATVHSALKQVEAVVEPDSVVILEIGGNDLLGGTDASVFRNQLDRLVCSLRSQRHRILMFELPLFPFRNAYGRAQRAVAAEHDVALLPKRRLSAVLGQRGGTVDGLHLSQQGHDALAAAIAGVLVEE